MNQDYWQKQTDKPLFPNILWSRPETKKGAGKLLIIGGQAEEFIHVAECFGEAEKAGAGTVRVIMPDSTARVTKMLPHIEYAAANASGSFAKEALAELLEAGNWADGVLLAGDMGKNSETSLMLESFINKYRGTLIISGQALPGITNPAIDLFNNENTIMATSFAGLQKLSADLKLEKPLTSGMGSVELAKLLHNLTTQYPLGISLLFNKTVWVSRKGRVASTDLQADRSLSTLAAQTAVWGIQNPNKIFEALVTAAHYHDKPDF